MTADASSPFRRRRVLLVLGPLAGTLGAFVGLAAGLDGLNSLGDLPPEGLYVTGAGFYFLATLATLVAMEMGWLRGQPLHATPFHLYASGCRDLGPLFQGLLAHSSIANLALH